MLNHKTVSFFIKAPTDKQYNHKYFPRPDITDAQVSRMKVGQTFTSNK